jgi:hypothetical protein
MAEDDLLRMLLRGSRKPVVAQIDEGKGWHSLGRYATTAEAGDAVRLYMAGREGQSLRIRVLGPDHPEYRAALGATRRSSTRGSRA